jgi:transposase
MGHQVKLMPAKFVKAFNIRNKNDAADAQAIWMGTQIDCKPVAVKTEAGQAVLALHRMRQQLVKFRTMQINSEPPRFQWRLLGLSYAAIGTAWLASCR